VSTTEWNPSARRAELPVTVAATNFATAMTKLAAMAP
jgi:hypothetical protein